MSLLDTASLIVTPNGYKEGKLYSVIPSDGSGDLSVTRATTATRVNSAGLVELVPYNLLSWSQDFTNGWYAYLGSITATANYGTAPDGTNTSTRILFTSNNQIWAKAISGLTNVNGTFSVYIKGVAGQTIAIAYGGTDNVVTLQSGWNRYSVTAVGTIDFIFIDTFGSTATDIEVWGGQVVEGSTAKDYQKTETRLNIPRLDYSNGTCPSLLVEPQRTNLLTYSSSFDNAAWTKVSSTATANTTISPSGIQDADTIAFSSGGYVGQILTSSGAHSYSVYAKYIGTQWLYVQNYNGNDFGAWFDIQNGVVGTIESGVTASIEQAENGFYRCTITMTASSSSSSYWVFFNTTGNGSFTRTGSSYFWGAQLEAGSYATSYIPTTSASVTRNADVISKTGISSLIGQTEGTMLCDIYNTTNSNFGIVLSQTLGDYTNSIYFFNVGLSNQFVAEVFTGGAIQMAYAKGSSLSIGRNKIAITYKNNDFAVALNGVVVWADTLGSVPTTNNLDFADAGIGTNYAYEVNAVALWKTRLTNTQLAQLTTI